MKKVLIIDYKLGNHQSVINALKFLGYDFMVSNSPKDIAEASVYILPGVGAFSEAMRNLEELNVIKPLEKEILKNKKPILGICLGMQILAEDSDENGFFKGLGWIKGHVRKIESINGIRVPHVGWNNIKSNDDSSPLFSKTEKNSNFYFDHSYHFICDKDFSAATFEYGNKMNAAIQKENIFGVQFHPEKSQTNGLKLYRSFLNHCQIPYA